MNIGGKILKDEIVTHGTAVSADRFDFAVRNGLIVENHAVAVKGDRLFVLFLSGTYGKNF